MNAGIDARAGLREEHTAQHCDGRSATDTDAGEAVRQDARNLLIAHRRLKDLLETHHIGDVAKDKAADLWSIGELIVAAFVVLLAPTDINRRAVASHSRSRRSTAYPWRVQPSLS